MLLIGRILPQGEKQVARDLVHRDRVGLPPLDVPDQENQEKVEADTQNQFNLNVMCVAKSRYSFEECYKYVLACQQVGQHIKSPYRLAKALHRTGEQDEEIALFLATGKKQDRARAA
jgi:hypothetical protein